MLPHIDWNMIGRGVVALERMATALERIADAGGQIVLSELLEVEGD